MDCLMKHINNNCLYFSIKAEGLIEPSQIICTDCTAPAPDLWCFSSGQVPQIMFYSTKPNKSNKLSK